MLNTERTLAKPERAAERIVLSAALYCGALAGAGYANEEGGTYPTEILEILKTARPVTDEEVRKRSLELNEHSPLARAIDAVPDDVIRGEGYAGDILRLKQRAKSQIQYLYWFREKVIPGLDILFSDAPSINIDIFARGARVYYDVPGDEQLMRFGYSRGDIESIYSEYEQAVQTLIGKPVKRVQSSKEANLRVFFEATPSLVVKRTLKTGKVEMMPAGHPVNLTEEEIDFPPLSKVRAVIAGKEGGIATPLGRMAKYPKNPELEKFVDVSSELYTLIHETCHLLGYADNKIPGHILNNDPTTADINFGLFHPQSFKLRGGRVFTDKKTGQRYLVQSMDGAGVLEKSSIVDTNFFLRLFVKQYNERQRN